jgi:hypothetical protein
MQVKSVKQELKEFAKNQILELDINLKMDVSDVHNEIFNSDYYIIGYYDCEEWLKMHNIRIFDAIEYCQNQELENFGETHTKFENSEVLVNNLVYWMGLEIIDEVIKEIKSNN